MWGELNQHGPAYSTEERWGRMSDASDGKNEA